MKMKWGVAMVGLVLLGILMPRRAPASLAAKTTGWINIFPLPSFKAWTRVAIPPDRALNPKSQWSVDAAHHTIVCAGNGGHEWLRYDRELGDFMFHVDWRLTRVEGAKNYNSGVFVRNSADGRTWYQAQVGSASGGYLFGDNPVNGKLVRFNLESMLTGNRVKKAGDWNTYDIRCQGSKITVVVNGTKTSEFERCANPKGYLGLEAEGSRMEFRNLRIKILP
ncbi:MAG: 3-keto-disaccharide hydrolase [Terriglobia bacterium]